MCQPNIIQWLLTHLVLQDDGSFAKAKPASQKAAGIGKDPSTHTSFLPDKDRELQEEQMREQLKQEYELRQQVCLFMCLTACSPLANHARMQ